ncbi:hypothetical protein ACQR1Y_11950 [Bradyrhizobium sp. HKCCYLRH3099]
MTLLLCLASASLGACLGFLIGAACRAGKDTDIAMARHVAAIASSTEPS